MLPLLTLLIACDLFDKGNEAWMPTCDSSETILDWDEDSALGFSGADLASALGGEATAPLIWAEGGETVLTLGLTWSDHVVFVDQWEAEPPEDVDEYPDIAVICDDYVKVDATASFVTDDGLLDDAFPVRLVALTAELATLSVDAVASDFANPGIFDSFHDPDATSEGVDITAEIAAGGATEGQLSFFTEGTDGETAWASTDTVASWGGELD